MEQANIPSQEGLNALYGAWNPMGYMQGMQNQELADQFRQQGFTMNNQDIQKNQMANDQSALMNPLLVAQQQNANVKSGVESRRMAHNEQAVLDADDRATALKMTEDEIKGFGDHATKMSLSQDPREREEGLKRLAMTPAIMAERRKAADAMALQKEQTHSHLAGINAQVTGNSDLEDKRINAGKYDSKTFSATVSSRLLSAKNPIEKMEILEDAYQAAISQGDVGSAANYKARYEAAQLRAAEQERLRANAKNTLDMSEYGMSQTAPLSPTAPISTGAKQDAPALPTGWIRKN